MRLRLRSATVLKIYTNLTLQKTPIKLTFKPINTSTFKLQQDLLTFFDYSI